MIDNEEVNGLDVVKVDQAGTIMTVSIFDDSNTDYKSIEGGKVFDSVKKTQRFTSKSYDESYAIYEDNILINELYKRKQFVVIPHWLTTSARRYEEMGIWKLQYHFWTIYVKKWFGASAEDIHRYYLKYIKA